MFSGIVEEIGKVKIISKQANHAILGVQAKKVLDDIRIGDSIAVNGVCLTVVKKEIDTLSFEIMPQTLKSTNLGQLRIHDRVNLQRSLKVSDRLSGHFVNGHIDCLGIIRKRHYIKGNLCYEISIPLEYLKFILPQGSVAIDGISLTVVNRKSDSFSVYIIPHTLNNTTLGLKGPSQKVNVELDILAKYIKSR